MRTLICLALSLPTMAAADYSVSERALFERAGAVVDATVTHFDADGHAHLEVHARWSGTLAPTEVKGVTYTCLLGSAQQAGLKVGQRYVIVVDARGNLFEEQSYYPIRDDAVKAHDLSKDWATRDWMPVHQFKAAVRAIPTAKRPAR